VLTSESSAAGRRVLSVSGAATISAPRFGLSPASGFGGRPENNRFFVTRIELRARKRTQPAVGTQVKTPTPITNQMAA
jgi:hypothetical protein